MQKRLLFLPVVWGLYGIVEVFVLNYLFGPILNNLPYVIQDKPIGGSYFPALFFNVTAFLVLLGLSLYALGIWDIDLSNPKLKRDLVALAIMLGSGFAAFYYAIFTFPLIVTVVYFLATNID